MSVSLNEIANDLKSYLQWQLDEGHKLESVSPAVMAELESAAVKSAKDDVAQQPAAPAVSPKSPEKQPRKETTVINNDSMDQIADEINKCTKCSLHEVRTNFVGEAPGADEDAQGIPFVGRSGKLLTKMIEAMGYGRDSVFIANINKCRPPDNRKPTPAEMEVCLPFLKRQIALLQPKVIVALGATAVEGLVGMPKGVGITKVRGQWLKFDGIDLMPTFHPAYMLRNPNMKRPVWEDLKAVLAKLGKPVPAAKK